jgi:hypothetical protein
VNQLEYAVWKPSDWKIVRAIRLAGNLRIVTTESSATAWFETSVNFTIRQAVFDDVPVLRVLIDTSVRGLQAQDYTPTQIESALATVYGVDSQLVADGTYFVVEAEAQISHLSARETSDAQPVTVAAEGGASGGHCTAEIDGLRGKIRCWIREWMRPRFGHSLSTQIGCGAGSGP